MRVLHALTLETARGGRLEQLRAEQTAAAELKLPWEIRLWSKDAASDPFVHQLPARLSPLGRRRRFVQDLKRLAPQYDVLVVRYDTSNPFLALAGSQLGFWFSEHHAMEPLERGVAGGLKGRTMNWLERQIGPRVLRHANGILAVTDEILQYELSRSGGRKPGYVAPNGIVLSTVTLSTDRRAGPIKLFCLATHFAPWHGLAEILRAFEGTDGSMELHVVGGIDAALAQSIEAHRWRERVILHGFVGGAQLPQLLAAADVGLSAFNPGATGLTQASRLKVRHLLALGVPVAAGEGDSSFPPEFAYYHQMANLDMATVRKLALEWRLASRVEIRSAAAPFIEKSAILERQYTWLRSIYQRAHGHGAH